MATYFDLVISCPACLSEGRGHGPASQWFHAKSGCSGKLQIGDDAQIKCTACGEKFHIKATRYSCEYHADFRPATSASFASAISTAGQMTSIAGAQWLIRVLQNAGEDW